MMPAMEPTPPAHLKQCTVHDVANHRVTKLHGRVIVITRFYPRFLKRRYVHDYLSVLAPLPELLKEFREAEKALGDHDRAFESVDYERKFRLQPEGMIVLKRLVEESRGQTIYFVCHCPIGQRCHRELVMLIAQELFGAKIAKLSFDWSIFRARLKSGEVG